LLTFAQTIRDWGDGPLRSALMREPCYKRAYQRLLRATDGLFVPFCVIFAAQDHPKISHFTRELFHMLQRKFLFFTVAEVL